MPRLLETFDSVFARNRQFIRDTITLLKQLQRQPRRKRNLALRIQENLIIGISRAERRIKADKASMSELKSSLRTPGNSKAAAQRTKKRLGRLREAIEEQRRLISLYRDIGDAIAFIYIDRFDLKPMAYNAAPGAITGKSGNRAERRFLRDASAYGVVAILNDLTSSLRHGDVTLVHESGAFHVVEVKSGAGGNRERAERQVAAIKSILDYLRTDRREFKGETFIRVNLRAKPKHHTRAFNNVVRTLRDGKQDWAFVKPERGLTYVALRGTGTFEEWRDAVRPEGIGINLVVNDVKGVGQAYYPLPLMFERGEDLIAFYQGEFVVIVCVDMVTVLKAMGLELEPRYGDQEWPIRFFRQSEGTEEPRAFGVGHHFFGRIAAEMLSPRTMVLHCTTPPDAEGQALIDAEAARLDSLGEQSVTSSRPS